MALGPSRVAILVAALAAGGSPGCRKDPSPTSAGPADARPAPQRADARVAPRPAPPQGWELLRRRQPAGARLFVALRSPEAWLRAVAALGPWLAAAPELTARVARLERSLAGWLGGWPPAPGAWARLGVDPAGGVAMAAVGRPGERAAGWWLGVLATDAPRLLGHLAGRTVRGAGPVDAPLPWGAPLRCAARPPLVECATADGLLGAPPRTGPLPEPDGGLVIALPLGSARLHVALDLEPEGLGLRARLEGKAVRELADLLASPGPLRPPPARDVAALFVRLAPGRIAAALGWLPRAWTTIAAAGAPAQPLLPLLSTASGRWWAGVSPAGWRLRGARRGGPSPFPQPTRVTVGGKREIYLRTGPAEIVLGSSAAVCAPEAGPPGGTGSAARPSSRALPEGSAALFLALTDPLEHVTMAARAKVVAALMGLPEPERAAVAAARVLASLLGEVWLAARPAPGGLELRGGLRSPAGGPPAARRRFREAWREKWRTGGFYSPEALTDLARRHPGTAAGRLGARLRDAAPTPRASAAYLALMLRGIASLRGPEVPCQTLSARLAGCASPLGRQLEPDRWLELDRLRQLGEQGDLGQDLEDRARRSAAALTARCDARQGRMERPRQVAACLALPDCAGLVTCLLGVFTPPAGAPRRSGGSPR